jgi:hypothetical protein
VAAAEQRAAAEQVANVQILFHLLVKLRITLAQLAAAEQVPQMLMEQKVVIPYFLQLPQLVEVMEIFKTATMAARVDPVADLLTQLAA